MSDYPDNLAERDYYDDLLGKGKADPDMSGYSGEPRYIGQDKPKIERYFDYSIIARGRGFPWEEDIDYDPRMDEDLEEN